MYVSMRQYTVGAGSIDSLMHRVDEEFAELDARVNQRKRRLNVAGVQERTCSAHDLHVVLRNTRPVGDEPIDPALVKLKQVRQRGAIFIVTVSHPSVCASNSSVGSPGRRSEKKT